jgi:hypothetical protein
MNNPMCQKCLLHDKSPQACQKRQCLHSPLPIPQTPPESAPDPIIREEKTITTDFAIMRVTHYYSDYFFAKILKVTDKIMNSYIKKDRYYRFDLITDNRPQQMIWAIPDESTERFHTTGSSPSQIVLYWMNDQFSMDIDS